MPLTTCLCICRANMGLQSRPKLKTSRNQADRSSLCVIMLLDSPLEMHALSHTHARTHTLYCGQILKNSFGKTSWIIDFTPNGPSLKKVTDGVNNLHLIGEHTSSCSWLVHIFQLHLIGSHTSACVFRLTSFVCMQETSSAKNKIMILGTKCQRTLSASDFDKKQQKKNQKGKPYMCLDCSAKKGSGKIPMKSGASSSRAPTSEVVS